MNNVGMYNQVDSPMQRRVYFVGTATLTAGQVLCYQENPATSLRTKGYPFDVELPNSDNVRAVAGIVAETSVGKTGPGFIDIIVPRVGDILQVKANRGADIALGDLLKFNHLNGTIASASTLGAWDALTYASSTDYTVANNNAAMKIRPLVQALESLASTATSSAFSLIYAKFLG